MVRITRWLTGWVAFTVSGRQKGQAERFLSLCTHNGKVLWEMQPIGDEKGFQCKIRASEYKELIPDARKCRVKVRLQKKGGFPFCWRKASRRKGILVGCALFLLLLWILSSRYWLITVSGNSQLAASTLLQAAQEEGLFQGAARREVDPQMLASALMKRFPEIGWISINTRGCSAEICLEEGIPTPEEQTQETPANILAAVDGVILSIDTFDGTAMVKAGEAVTQGQLLISGIKENQLGGTSAVYARGKIVAKTRRSFSAQVPMEQVKAVKTGQTVCRRSLTFFGITLPLNLHREPEGLWQREREKTTLTLLGTELPAFVTQETWFEYRETPCTLTRKEAEELAWDMIELQQRELLGAEGRVLSEEANVKIQSGKLCLTVNSQCQEEIGVTQQILFE